MARRRKRAVSERDAFDRIAVSLNDAALDDTRWPAVSALLDEACGATGNILSYGYGNSFEDVRILFSELLYRGERREEIEREYFDVYYRWDERVPRIRELPDSRVVHCRETYTEDELKTSAAYNEMLPRGQFQNSLSVRLDGAHGTRITWGIADPVDGAGWSSARLDTVRRILPHLRQFVSVRQALIDARALGRSLTGLLDIHRAGVVQLDGRGRIVAANDFARELLRNGDGLSDQQGVLKAWSPDEDAGFQTLVGRALGRLDSPGTGGTAVLLRPTLKPRLVVHVGPVGDGRLDFRPWRVAALALIVDPARRVRVDPGLVAQALNLTPAESQVAVMLAEGKSVGEVAAATGRKASTVRWHMLHIFNKNAISRQVELVQMVQRLADIPPSGR